MESTVATSGGGSASPYHRAMPRRLVSPTLVGRVTELDAIARALDSAAAGGPDPPVDRRRGWRRQVPPCARDDGGGAARGMRVLEGGCADIGDGGVPYGPIVEALRTLARSLDTDELETVLGADTTRAGPSRAIAQPGRRGDDGDPDGIAPGPSPRRGAGRSPAAVGDRARSCSSSRISIGPIRRHGRLSPSSSVTSAPTVSLLVMTYPIR